MLKGRVNRQGEPLVPISLILRIQPTQYFGVVDTGFNGYLSVPKRLLRRSRWEAIGTERFEIATGALVEQEIYLGDIVFDGVRGPAYAVATDAREILIGTKLLRKKVLKIDFSAGTVVIAPAR